MGGEINDYRVVRTVDFKERFVYLASIIHRRYSCIYIYIYIVRTQWQFVCDTIDDEQRRYARFGYKRFRRGRSMCVVCVCVCVCCARCKAVNYFFLRPSPRSSPLIKRKRLPSVPRN